MGTTFNMADYDAVREAFRWERPERFNFAGDVVDDWAARTPEALALLCVDADGVETRRTYAELAAASRRVASMLTANGIDRGDVVILVLGRDPAWWEVMTGTIRMGAIASPGTTQLSAKDIAHRIQVSGARAVVVAPALVERVDAAAAQCPDLALKVVVGEAPDGWVAYAEALERASDDFETVDTAGDEPSICYFTSGTTRHPKMVLHSQVSYGLAHDSTGRHWLDQRPGDLHWNISDTGWGKAAYSSYYGPLRCGSTLFVDRSERFDGERTLALLDRYPVTTLCAPPTVYRSLVQQDLSKYRFATLRHCVGAGEPLNPEVIDQWQVATGLFIRDGYGQTETVLLCGAYPCLAPRAGSMGKPAPGFDLQIIGEDGEILPPGEEGDIAVRVEPERPLGLFIEYWKDPERTAETLRGPWYVTGDRGHMDGDGYFWFSARADDVITSAGYRIGPFEVESALIEHPAVAESAVVASPDELRGALVKAFVVLAPGYEGDEALVEALQAHCKEVTAPYKYPRLIEFVADLPKTISGKIRRVELREREWKA